MKNYIKIYATLKSNGKYNINRHQHLIRAEFINEFKASKDTLRKAISFLKEKGAIVTESNELIVRFSMERTELEKLVKANIKVTKQKDGAITYSFDKQPNLKEISHVFDHLELPPSAAPLSVSPTPPPLGSNQRDFNYIKDILDVDDIHQNYANKGAGTTVAVIDTGFAIMTKEPCQINGLTLSVDNDILDLYDISLSDKYSSSISLTGITTQGNTIVHSNNIPFTEDEYWATYAYWHPFYTAQGYPNLNNPISIPFTDPTGMQQRTLGAGDVDGHGIMVAAHAQEVAPEANYQFLGYYKPYHDSQFLECMIRISNFLTPPDVVNCSWGMSTSVNYLQSFLSTQLVIADIVANGSTVVCGAGNGQSDLPFTAPVEPIAHPDIVSIGGSIHMAGTSYRVSDISSSFDSFRYQIPQRHVPDLTALSGGVTPPERLMSPTAPDRTRDQGNSTLDGTQPDDGWAAAIGTSLAAPQVAGIVSLLKSSHQNLTPRAIKNILENACLDVTVGTSHHGDAAHSGWNKATGYGIVKANEAFNFLRKGTQAFIRDIVKDNGSGNSTNNIPNNSPDIINRYSPNDAIYLGITTKHKSSWSKPVNLNTNNYLYLRIQNKGVVSGPFTAYIYVTDTPNLGTPANWQMINQTSYNQVNAGDFDVFGPVQWNPANFNLTSDPQFIVVLDSSHNHMPGFNTIVDQASFENWVRTNNNVAWKGTTSTNLDPGLTGTIKFPGEIIRGIKSQLKIAFNHLEYGNCTIRIRKSIIEDSTKGLKLIRSNRIYSYYQLNSAEAFINTNGDIKGENDIILSYQSPEGNETPVGSINFYSNKTLLRTVNITNFKSAYIGNLNSKELHASNCSFGKRSSDKNKVGFEDITEAIAEGFDPCGHCMEHLDKKLIKLIIKNPLA